jgi:hypothetical protein
VTGGQCIAYLMLQTSALTNLTSTRIYNGNRPDTTVVPCINFYEMAGGQRINGFERVAYSINCRAATAETALTIARKVDELFNGTSGTGVYGYTSSGSAFEITRASTRQRQGLIPEPDDGLYNAPVDIFIVYPASSIV